MRASSGNKKRIEAGIRRAALRWEGDAPNSIANSDGSKEHLAKSGPLLRRSVAAPHNFSHPQSKRNEVRKSRNNVPFVV
jgi:hypothetical protein